MNAVNDTVPATKGVKPGEKTMARRGFGVRHSLRKVVMSS